jgi:hypothetical protein
MIAYCSYFYVQNGLKLGRYTKQHMLEKGMQLSRSLKMQI